MARNGSSKGGGNSRVRFIMLEAEIGDGDFSQITEAITNALRPSTVIQQRLITAPTVATSTSAVFDADLASAEVVVDEIDGAPSEVVVRAANKSSSQQRRYRSPRVIDLDLVSDLSFAEFAAQKRPTNDQKRFLVAAAWLRMHRGMEAITMDHVYTCFRSVKWPTAIDDFDSPLRALKKRQLMNKAGRGAYTINHLGLAEVDGLGNEDSSE